MRLRFNQANATVPFEVELDEVIQNVFVPRRFISSVFGGCSQIVHPLVSKEKYDLHRRNNYMIVGLDHHPSAPPRPGAHGVWHENAVCKYRDPNVDPFVADFMEIKC